MLFWCHIILPFSSRLLYGILWKYLRKGLYYINKFFVCCEFKLKLSSVFSPYTFCCSLKQRSRKKNSVWQKKKKDKLVLRLLETSFSANMDRIAIHKENATLVLRVFWVATNERDSPDKKQECCLMPNLCLTGILTGSTTKQRPLRLTNISQTMKKNNK